MDINKLNDIILNNKNSINIVLPKEKEFKIESAIGKPLSKYSSYKNKLIDFKDINKTLYKLDIDGTEYDYITIDGEVYLYCGDGKFFKRSVYQNNVNKYMYVLLYIDGQSKNRRIHNILAKTFIPNKYPN